MARLPRPHLFSPLFHQILSNTVSHTRLSTGFTRKASTLATAGNEENDSDDGVAICVARGAGGGGDAEGL
jgi:hypothetical protein